MANDQPSGEHQRAVVHEMMELNFTRVNLGILVVKKCQKKEQNHLRWRKLAYNSQLSIGYLLGMFSAPGTDA